MPLLYEFVNSDDDVVATRCLTSGEHTSDSKCLHNILSFFPLTEGHRTDSSIFGMRKNICDFWSDCGLCIVGLEIDLIENLGVPGTILLPIDVEFGFRLLVFLHFI